MSDVGVLVILLAVLIQLIFLNLRLRQQDKRINNLYESIGKMSNTDIQLAGAIKLNTESIASGTRSLESVLETIKSLQRMVVR